MQHMMIDIETLGTGPDAVVLSIGAVEFSVEHGIGTTFHAKCLSVEEQVERGREIDPQTLRWWVDQMKNKGAPVPLSLQLDGAVAIDMENMLRDLTEFVRTAEPDLVWANAPSFDCTILHSLAADYGLSTPWMFYDEACYRTWKRMASASPNFTPVKPERAHDALSDAIAQAKTMITNHSIVPF